MKRNMSENVPLRLNKYMSRTRFEVILLSLCYTNIEGVEYSDGFFHMRQMEESWNMNISDELNLSWINIMENL